MDPNTPMAEAERCLNIAVKLLTARDFLGSKTFAIRARESDPNNPISDQILAVVETVLAGEKRVNPSQHPDWYSVLQLPRLVRDPELIANHYRRLVMLLNPERNRLPFADYGLQLVMDAWSILSDPNKKWVFDNELTVFLQKAVQLQHQQPQPLQQPPQQPPQALPVRVEAMRVEAAATSNSQINTFQFFHPQPSAQQPTVSMWQQHQQPEYHQNHQRPDNDNNNQLHQIEFMQPPPLQPPQPPQLPPLQPSQPPQLHPPQPPQLQPSQTPQLQPSQPPQWQMRDPPPSKGGERNKGILNGISGGIEATGVTTTIPIISTPVMRRVADVALANTPRPATAPLRPPSSVVVPASVTATTRVIDGNVANIGNNNVINDSDANIDGVVHGNDNGISNGVVHGNDNGISNGVGDTAANENNGVEEEVESFWTSCPYCFYIYEYQKVYQDCTLRCQNCRRGFQAVQIPNPPPISGGENDKKSSFCCWGFFPLGFSTVAWKKHNRMGKSNVASNWVPFSPMFASPVENEGGRNFQWFESKGGGSVGPKNMGRPPVSRPRVYVDYDDDFDSDPSDSDSSDHDWRRNPAHEKMRKKKKRRNGGAFGRPRKNKPQDVDAQNQANPNSVIGGGVSVGEAGVKDGSGTQNVDVGLTDGAKEDARKKVAATLKRNQARRRVKNMGKLDLNVEFNNEGDEHAPTVSAANGDEDAIANIGFFEGLDEFFSTLPILNVGGEEKAKPS